MDRYIIGLHLITGNRQRNVARSSQTTPFGILIV
jgi:hypothetical protein